LIEWNFTNVSVIGSSHLKTGLPCQDANRCLMFNDREPILIAVVSDGAGSAQYADLGSSLVCNSVLEKLKAFFQSGNTIDDLNKEYVETLIQDVNKEIREFACLYNSTSREFACTIISAVVCLNKAIFFQIGDGAIVVMSPDDNGLLNWVFWPQNGEYANTTFFLTDENAITNMNYDIVNKPIDKIAIITDGLQNIALHYQSKTVYQPFFQKCFEILKENESRSINEKKELFTKILSSDLFNERTDDDKTLILAERRSYLEDVNESI